MNIDKVELKIELNRQVDIANEMWSKGRSLQLKSEAITQVVKDLAKEFDIDMTKVLEAD